MGSWFSSEYNPGDLIEIFRTGFQHWAIYVGSGYVIHLAPPSESPGAGAFNIGFSFSLSCDMAEVKKELLRDVAGGCRYRVNNSLDKQQKPLPVQQILRSANSMIGKKVENAVAMMGGGLIGALGAVAGFGAAIIAYSAMSI